MATKSFSQLGLVELLHEYVLLFIWHRIIHLRRFLVPQSDHAEREPHARARPAPRWCRISVRLVSTLLEKQTREVTGGSLLTEWCSPITTTLAKGFYPDNHDVHAVLPRRADCPQGAVRVRACTRHKLGQGSAHDTSVREHSDSRHCNAMPVCTSTFGTCL